MKTTLSDGGETKAEGRPAGSWSSMKPPQSSVWLELGFMLCAVRLLAAAPPGICSFGCFQKVNKNGPAYRLFTRGRAAVSKWDEMLHSVQAGTDGNDFKV